jgi:LuxR family maltose regulon positive regulatory protein
VRNQLVEVRSDELRFQEHEAAQFLTDIMGLQLSPDDVPALEQRTEGWPAGLQLAAVSLRGHGNPHAFVTAFSGSHRYIVDYLADEVLARQSEATQLFLLQTSIVDRLYGPLCDAITGGTTGQATLVQLEQAQLFLVPLDTDRRWYRYHTLFRAACLSSEPWRILPVCLAILTISAYAYLPQSTAGCHASMSSGPSRSPWPPSSAISSNGVS